jgi:tripartite-type tricarboxylate transporter receptor subunit TctC
MHVAVGELMEEAKKREITVAVSSPKGGDEYHIAFINLKKGTKFIPVPYAKPTERYAAQLGGHVELQVEQYGSMQPFMAEKKIRPILHFGPKRDDRFPDVESSYEYSLPVSLPIFRGFLMKKGTDEIIMQKLEKAFKYVYNHPEFQALNTKNKVDKDSWYGRGAYTKLMEDTWDTAAPVIKELGWTAKK